MFRTLLKERADALLDKIPALEQALNKARALDENFTAAMNDFSESFREFRALEKMIGPPVRSTGTEMAVREVVRRLEWMETVWRDLADRELSDRGTAAGPACDRIGFGCAAGKRLKDLKVADWVAPDLLSVFSDANGGRLGHLDLFCGDADPAALAAPYLSPDWTADPDGDAYYAINLDIGAPDPRGRRTTARHIIVIDRLETLRSCLAAICYEEMLPSEYEFSLAFTVEWDGHRRHVHLDAVSTGSILDPLGLSRKKGVTSATFKRFVDILASFYPGIVSTCAASPVTEHWFKKYFNAVLLNAETENLFYGVTPPPGS
jgi:hypothetical protein